MDEIIAQIKKEMENRGISEHKLAEMAGTNQPKVHRTLAGKSRFKDIDAINNLADTLGIVREAQVEYGSSRILTPDERKALEVTSRHDEVMEFLLKYEETPELELFLKELKNKSRKEIRRAVFRALEEE